MKSPALFMKPFGNPIVVSFAIVGAALLLPYLLVPSSDELSRNDIARIAELRHLRQTVGDAVWPGFGQAQIPLALAKGRREYLFDHPSPPSGSILVSISKYPGTAVYRKGHTVPGIAMTAGPIGGVPTACMPDKAIFDQVISLEKSASEESTLAVAMSGGEETDTAVYELVAIHESFHAFQFKQGMNRVQDIFDLPPGSLNEKLFAQRLRQAEATNEITNMLRTESLYLAEALSADDPITCLEKGRLFLKMRDARRQATSEKAEGLTVASIAANENAIEWSEGVANYVQGRVLKLASDASYRPLALIAGDRGFGGYKQPENAGKWSLDHTADMSCRTRSYVVGAGICSLLDRLGAEWKTPVMKELTPLTELLRHTLESRPAQTQNRTWTPISKGSY